MTSAPTIQQQQAAYNAMTGAANGFNGLNLNGNATTTTTTTAAAVTNTHMRQSSIGSIGSVGGNIFDSLVSNNGGGVSPSTANPQIFWASGQPQAPAQAVDEWTSFTSSPPLSRRNTQQYSPTSPSRPASMDNDLFSNVWS